ncbi:MAG: thiamine phosphate synthase [Candidatus Omnitrophica bacterium]|nr:thiamine phosphate synthase [Candidatus Omnitrophota bacterium]
MKLKKTLLKKSALYVIADNRTAGKRNITGIINKIKKSGVDIIQYRDKGSTRAKVIKNAFIFKKALADTDIIFIINDHLDVAKIVDSDGVHLGQEDIPIEIARRVLGKDKIIGISCHNLKQAFDAQVRGADYIGFGPVFATPTKPQYRPIGTGLINKLKKKIRIPFFLIGGIDQDNLTALSLKGVTRAAVCRAVIQANDPAQASEYLRKILHKCPLN